MRLYCSLCGDNPVSGIKLVSVRWPHPNLSNTYLERNFESLCQQCRQSLNDVITEWRRLRSRDTPPTSPTDDSPPRRPVEMKITIECRERRLPKSCFCP
jgi:hypothetical protein